MQDDYEVVAVNYWRGLKKEDVDRTLWSTWGTLLLIHNSVEFKEFKEFLDRLPHAGRIVYISLTKACGAIEPHLSKIRTKIFVVDCVSRTVFEKKETETCFFEYPPSNLRELTTLVDRYIKKINPEIIILDSLSQLIDFSSISIGRDAYSFFNYLKERSTGNSCRFILLYDYYLSKDLKNLPKSHIDIILKLELIEDRIYWEG